MFNDAALKLIDSLAERLDERRVRVAYYSPMPPERSGIADYSALLVPALRKRVDVDVAQRDGTASGDVALYHVGNDAEVHGWILERLRTASGRRRPPRLRAPSPRRRRSRSAARTRRRTSRRSSATAASLRGCSGSA